ncbi:OmpA family protein [Paracoccus sp. MC1862]|uniref:OmpA family protein n=1 Tax=Paracoccus sp. MC1862 TaxID=2760307 RepID=UPI001602EC28|nr:OmpA family protein [Paracoccus sp. MC1862]MBB1499244.1 OmpA family protein [Paracoccus sp. MC1862]QQO44874.1 OmpA family protein [Paracoccus sp. MC1862]
MPRRTLRNTTALALGLSVALPHFTVAQTALIEEKPASLVMAQVETGNPPEVPPEAVEGADVSGEAVEAAEETAQPEAEAASAEAPAGEAEETAAEAEAAAEPATEEAADAMTAPQAVVPEAQPEPEARPEPVEAAEPETEPAPEPAADAQPDAASAEPEAEPAAPQAEPAAEPQAEAAPEPVPEAPAPVAVETTTEPEAQTTDEPEASANDAAEATVDTEAAEATTDGGTPGEADLARALAEEGESEADAAGTASDASAPATGDNAADATTAIAAPGDSEADSNTGEPSPEGELVEAREVPEAEAPTTDISREAAAGGTPPAAAALAGSAAPVTTSETREVTDETSRSATEDFQTDLRGELRASGAPVVGGAAQQDAAQQGTSAEAGADQDTRSAAAAREGDDDDDRSNLEQVLRQAVLPALAGLAVGQLLSNDRQVELNTGDRVVVTRPDGSQEIIKDDNALLLRPGSTVQTEEYADGSTRTIVAREDGSQVVTIRDADLRVLRRTLVQPDGTTTALIDETAAVAPVDVANLPPPARPITVAPGERLSEDALREALRRETQVGRTFSLGQIRNIPEVRALVAPVEVQAITFDTGSAAIKPDQAQALSTLGRVIAESIRRNPAEIYMIEGHTDTVGADAMNLALSDRRAESVALALTEFFGVPPENMVVQGYGEQFLKVPQEGDIRANRRAAVRRITDLLARN